MYITDDAIKENTDSENVDRYNFSGSPIAIWDTTARETNYQIATFESDGWPLDGTVYFDSYLEHLGGLRTTNLSDNNKSLLISVNDGYPKITFSYITPQDITSGITISMSNECLEEFNLYYYGSSDVIIKTVAITENSLSDVYISDIVNGVYKITIEAIKTKSPNRFGRIANIEYGRVMDFKEDSIVSVDSIAECDPLLQSMPNGQIDFTLISEGDDFSITNPQGIYKNLRQNLGVYHYKNENGVISQQGKYYLSEWSEISDKVFKFSAVDTIGWLKTRQFKGSVLMSNYYVGSLLSLMIDDSGYSGTISGYDASDVINGFAYPQSCADLLLLICVVFNWCIKVDNSGNINFYTPDFAGTTDMIYYEEMLSSLKADKVNNINNYSIGFTTYTPVSDVSIHIGSNFDPIYQTISNNNKDLDYDFDLSGLQQYSSLNIDNFDGKNFIANSCEVLEDVHGVSTFTFSDSFKHIGYIIIRGKCETNSPEYLDTSKTWYTIELTGTYLNNINEAYAVSKLDKASQCINSVGNTLITTDKKAREIGNALTSLTANKLRCTFAVEKSKLDDMSLIAGSFISITDKYGNVLSSIISKISHNNSGIAQVEVISNAV